MRIKDIAITAAEIVGDSALMASLGGEAAAESAEVRLMLNSVLSALRRVAVDYPAPDGEEQVEDLDGEVTCTCADLYTTAYLAARNYCLFNGHTDEASYFDGLYDELAERHRLKRRASLPHPSRMFT